MSNYTTSGDIPTTPPHYPDLPTFTLADDGTLDTVLQCGACEAQERYNFANSDYGICSDDHAVCACDRAQYDAFVNWAIQDATDTHTCD